jgi:signal transduction histidine kinase
VNSIRKHLTLHLLLGFTVLLGTVGAIIYFSARSELYHEFDASLRVKAVAMAALTKPGKDKVDFEFPKRVQPVESPTSVIEFYQLYDINGVSLVRSPTLGEADLPQRLGTMQAPACWNFILPDGNPGRAIGVRFTAKPPSKEKKPPPADAKPKEKDEAKEPKAPPAPVDVGLVVAGNRVHLDAQLGALLTLLLVSAALGVAGTVLLVMVVLRRDLVPLQKLAAQAENIHAASLQMRFASDDLPEELAPIVHRLNDLLSRLETSFERERRFSSDLAHELRTPLTGLRSATEVGLKWGEPADKRTFQTIHGTALHIENLVTRLLALARSEQRSLPLDPSRVALAMLLNEVWQPLRDQAARKNLTVRFNTPTEATLMTDTELLRGILQNLLANSTEYTPEGGQVEITFNQTGGQFTLTISNTAAGLEPADLPKLFDRFWRKEASRTDGTHSGLGLPLARSFAGLLGFELTAAMTSPDQLTLRLTGPEETTSHLVTSEAGATH